jgi:phage-related protein
MPTFPAFPTLSVPPSTTTQLQMNFNTLFSQFGGNYVQIAPGGINFAVPTWNLEYDNLNLEDSATLETFLNSIGAALFTFSPAANGLSGPGSVWFINQTQNSYGYQKTCNGLVNTYQVSITMVY